MAKSFKQMAQSLNRYFTKEVKAAGVTSINRALATTRSKAAKDASEATGGQQKYLRPKMGVYKATAARPKGAMITKGTPISLSAFSPKSKNVKSSRGRRVGTTVNGPQGRYLVPAASMVTYASGKTSVFTRVGTKTIKNLYTNALIKHMEKPEVTRALTTVANVQFDKEFAYEIKRRKLEE